MRITLVEDNEIFRFLFRKFIENYSLLNIELEIFPNGLLAWNHFLSIKDYPEKFPDILFIDLNMPLLSGWGLIENLLSNNINFISSIPVYIASSSSNSLEIEKITKYSFIKEYIKKPYQKDQIYSILNQYTSSK